MQIYLPVPRITGGRRRRVLAHVHVQRQDERVASVAWRSRHKSYNLSLALMTKPISERLSSAAKGMAEVAVGRRYELSRRTDAWITFS